ncbi:MAG TPA: ABC transporter ATP-binding protein [Bacteroidota bacterium]
MGPALILSDFSFRYFEGGPPVFSQYSLSLPPGCCCALLGPTGAGKSTLLSVIAGIAGSQFKTAIANGSVQLGNETHNPLPMRIQFPQVGLVLQDPSVQISGIRETVQSEIELTLENLAVRDESRAQRVLSTLRLLGIEHLADRHPRRVSGGEMQRIALASVVVAYPEVLLLDEPTSALDSDSQIRLKAILRSLRSSATIVLTDTAIDFALNLVDVFVVLDKGRNVFVGTQADLLSSLHDFEHLLPVGTWSKLRRSDVWHSLGKRIYEHRL